MIAAARAARGAVTAAEVARTPDDTQRDMSHVLTLSDHRRHHDAMGEF